MKLSTLFSRTLHTMYTHVENSADFALRRVGVTLYIYFAGSDGEADWKNNLNFPAKAYPRVGNGTWYAHRGFLKVWKTIEDYVAADIMDPSVQKIVISGYSHGAALAVLCHEYVWYNRPDLRESLEGYGFGCPRVVFGFLSHKLRARWERFTVIRNLDDIVTHLPPALLGFTHVGTMLEIGELGRYTRIDAHRPKNYLTELRRYEASGKEE
ncbi:MAG: lipase family protein [Clostridia bacterium]|nr:lipase family protein [Clostridia bacterium]